MRSPADLELIATIADGLAAGVWVATAPEGKFVYANRAFAEISLTGGAFTPRAQTFLERVPNTTLEKPFDGAALQERVRKLVRGI